MNKGLKAVIWIVVLVLVIWGISAISTKNNISTDTGTGPIKIGALIPLTGDAAVYGEPAKNMYQLAIDEINANGGIDGRQLELIAEDSKCVGEAAASATQKLVNVDKVQVIIGGFCSGESFAAVPIAETAKVALLSPGSSNPGLTDISPYFFRDYPSDATQGQVLAAIAYNDKGFRNVAFIQEQTDYSAGIYQAFDKEFKKLGGNTTNVNFPTETSDFRSMLIKIRDSKPDAMFIVTQTPAVAVRIMQQSQQLQYKPFVIGSDAISGDPDTVSKNAVFLEGALAAEFGTDSQNQKFQNMLASYKAKYGIEPPYQSYAQTEYDAVYIIRDALLANGNDGEKIAEWARSLKNWDGASGKVTILPTGDRDGGHIPKMIQGGKVVPYVK